MACNEATNLTDSGVFLSVDKKTVNFMDLDGMQGSACRQPTMPLCGSSLAPHGAFGVGCLGLGLKFWVIHNTFRVRQGF